MKDMRGLHLKVQELCDCFATTDPLKEMSEIQGEQDIDEAALKWLSLAVLHGINSNARKITFTRTEDGNTTVAAEYRTALLPSPGSEIGRRIIEAVQRITHLDGEKGKTPLALGIRNGSIEITVKMKKKDDSQSVTLKFPE